MACRSLVLVLFLCTLLNVANSQNKEYDCPEFNRNRCKENPTYENQIIYGCSSDDDCGYDRKCCHDCRYAYRICTEVDVEEFVSSQAEYLKNKYCPKVKPCTIPLKYDRKYRCGSDEGCSYGYKCCKSDCYIHKVCIPPVDEEENEIVPPPTTTTTTAQPETTVGVVTSFTSSPKTNFEVSDVSWPKEFTTSKSVYTNYDNEGSTNKEPSPTTFLPTTVLPASTTTLVAETSSEFHATTQITKGNDSSNVYTNSSEDEFKPSSGASTKSETQPYVTTTSLRETTVSSITEFSTVTKEATTQFPETSQRTFDPEGSGSGDDSESGDDEKFEIPEPISKSPLPSTLAEANTTFVQSSTTTSTTAAAEVTANDTEEISWEDGFTNDENIVKTSQLTKTTIIPTTIQEKLNVSFSTESFITSSTVADLEESGETTNNISTLTHKTFTPFETNSTVSQAATIAVTTDFQFDGEDNSTSFTTVQQDHKVPTQSTLDPNPDVDEGSGDSDDEDLAFSSTFTGTETTKKLPAETIASNTPTMGDFDYGDETSKTTTATKSTIKKEEAQLTTASRKQEENFTLKAATTQQSEITTRKPDIVTAFSNYLNETLPPFMVSTEKQSTGSEKTTTSTIKLEAQQLLNFTTQKDSDLGFFTDKGVFSSSTTFSTNKTISEIGRNTTTTGTSAFTFSDLPSTVAVLPRKFSDDDLEDGSGISDDEDLAFSSPFASVKTTKGHPDRPIQSNTPTMGDVNDGNDTSTTLAASRQTFNADAQSSTTNSEQASTFKIKTTHQARITTPERNTVTTSADYLNETAHFITTSTERQPSESENVTTGTVELETQQSSDRTREEGSELPSSSTTTPSSKTATIIVENVTTINVSAFTTQEPSKTSSDADLEDGSRASGDVELNFTVTPKITINDHPTLLPEDIRDEGKHKFTSTTNNDFVYEENTTTSAPAPQIDLIPDVVEDMDLSGSGNVSKDTDSSTVAAKDVQEKPGIISELPDLNASAKNLSSALPKRLNESLISMLGETIDSVEAGSGFDPYDNGDEEDDTDDEDDVDEEIRRNFNMK